MQNMPPKFLVKEISSPPIQNQNARHASDGSLYGNVNRSIKGQSPRAPNVASPNVTMSRYEQNGDATHSPYEILPHDTAEETASWTRHRGAQVGTNGVYSHGGQSMPNTYAGTSGYTNQQQIAPTLEGLAGMNVAPKNVVGTPAQPHYLSDTQATIQLRKQSPSHFHVEEHRKDHTHHLSKSQMKNNVSYYEDVRKHASHSSKTHEDLIAGSWVKVLENGLALPSNHDAVEASRALHQRQSLNGSINGHSVNQYNSVVNGGSRTDPGIPRVFIDSHRVQEQKTQQQLLAKRVAEEKQQRHSPYGNEGLNDAMTRWKQSTTIAVSSINALKLDLSHANLNMSTLIKYILELEKCVTKDQYERLISMERPDSLIKEPMTLAPTPSTPPTKSNSQNHYAGNHITPEQFSKNPIIMNAVDKARQMSQQMVDSAIQEVFERSMSPQTTPNSEHMERKLLYPGMSDPVEPHSETTNEVDSSVLHKDIYEKVLNSPFKGGKPPKALVEDRNTMLNILFDDSGDLQTRERVAKAIAIPFNGKLDIPHDVKDDRTRTLELLFNL
eukprot:g12788.t1